MQLERLRPLIFQTLFSNNFCETELNQFCNAVPFVVAVSLPLACIGHHLTASLKVCMARIIVLRAVSQFYSLLENSNTFLHKFAYN